MRWGVGLLILIPLLFAFSGMSTTSAGKERFRKFDRIYEPSGALQLPDGRFLVVEDEAAHPLSVFTLGELGVEREQPLWRASLFSIFDDNRELRNLDDLEGVSLGRDGWIYAITSHSRKESGKRNNDREQLLRFRLDGDQVEQLQVVRGLRKAIRKTHGTLKAATKIREVKQENGFIIEGLAFDGQRESLLIGLRGPRLDERAVVIRLRNPAALFEEDVKPDIDPRLITLDLARGGIRAMEWDDHLDGYLIVSRRPGKSFKLWLWSGDPDEAPQRLRSDAIKQLRQAEGITPVRRDGQPLGVLIVSDEGSGLTGRPGRYLRLDYSQIRRK